MILVGLFFYQSNLLIYYLTTKRLGLPALHGLLNPVRETIGVKLLRSMGWRPNQGAGERLTRREKKERRRKNQQWQSYGCPLPPGLKTQQSDGER